MFTFESLDLSPVESWYLIIFILTILVRVGEALWALGEEAICRLTTKRPEA